MLQPTLHPSRRVWYYGMRTLVGLVLLFLFLPILVVVPLSFNSDTFLMYPMGGFSMRWYAEIANSEVWQRAMINSLIVSPLSTLLAMVLGTLAAIGLVRTDFPGKALLTAVLISPMVVPVVIAGVAMYIVFAPLGLTGSYTGLIIAHAVLGVPFVVTTVTATLQGFDFNLVRAASSLGADPVSTFFKGHAAAGGTGHHLRRAVRVRHFLRRGGGDTVPGEPGAGHAAAPDVRRHPREHQPGDRGGRDHPDRAFHADADYPRGPAPPK